MFSIDVQKPLNSIQQPLVTTGTDRERRIGIVLRHTKNGDGFKADLEARQVQLVRGSGFQHDRCFDL
jgi:hypothetical protein